MESADIRGKFPVPRIVNRKPLPAADRGLRRTRQFRRRCRMTPRAYRDTVCRNSLPLFVLSGIPHEVSAGMPPAGNQDLFCFPP